MTESHVGLIATACRDFAEAGDLQETLDATVRQTRLAIGPEAFVRVALPDPAGSLRTAVSIGGAFPEGDRLGAGRRKALASGSPVQVELTRQIGDRNDHPRLWVYPLVTRGSSLGLLEVLVDEPTAVPRRIMEAIATLAAAAIRNVSERERMERQLALLAGPVRLAEGILRQHSPRAAIRATALFIRERMGMPVAAWYGADRESLELVLLRLPAGADERLARSDLARLPRSTPPRRPDRSATVDRFRELTGGASVSVIEAADALILFGGEGGDWCGPLTHLLQEVLRAFGRRVSDEQQMEELQLGLAITAHELRNPLLGARAAIDAALEEPSPREERQLLDRSRRQLEELAQLVEQLLQWSVGRFELRRAPVALSPIVVEAATSPPLDAEGHRLDLTVHSTIVVDADEPQLRLALSNIVRNAFAYSPPDAGVTIDVSDDGGEASVLVRDRGPGIHPSEVKSIFEPLVRGSTGTRRRGRGLGLFIARRVIEAHDGTISVEPSDAGAAFRVRLPAASGL